MPRLECLCSECQKPFVASKYSGGRQMVCASAACRKAAKKARQAAWTARNPDYFRGPEHVERVRQWRRANPGWREKQRGRASARGRESRAKAESCNQGEGGEERLQDSVPEVQSALIVGLATVLCGSVLQDEVHDLCRECLRVGGDLLRGSRELSAALNLNSTGSTHDGKIPNRPSPHTSDTATI